MYYHLSVWLNFGQFVLENVNILPDYPGEGMLN